MSLVRHAHLLVCGVFVAGGVLGSDAQVAASGSLLYSLLHDWSSSSDLFVQRWQVSTLLGSAYLQLSLLQFLLQPVSVTNTDSASIQASCSLTLPAASLYNTGTPVLQIPPIDVVIAYVLFVAASLCPRCLHNIFVVRCDSQHSARGVRLHSRRLVSIELSARFPVQYTARYCADLHLSAALLCVCLRFWLCRTAGCL